MSETKPSPPLKQRSNKRFASKKKEQDKQRAYRKNKLFRRIEADIKERDRRRIPGKSEEYVDKSRVIPVNLGPQDIRTSMLRQRMFLNKTYVFMQEEQQGYKVFVEQAAHEMHRGAYDRALSYLNRAIRLNPDEPCTLIERATCLVGLQHFDEALVDVNRALSNGFPTSKALYVKGDALYHLGDFEHALVFYHRAIKRSCSNAEEDQIRNRINRATEAIENAIGVKADGHFLAMPSVLNSIPSTIFGMPWHELKALHKNNDSETSARKKHRRSLLGKLSKDLDYLEELLMEVKVNPQQEKEASLAEEILSKEAEEGIHFLRERQEFWSQFKPMYSK